MSLAVGPRWPFRGSAALPGPSPTAASTARALKDRGLQCATGEGAAASPGQVDGGETVPLDCWPVCSLPMAVAPETKSTQARGAAPDLDPYNSLTAGQVRLDAIFAVLVRPDLPSMGRYFAHQRPELLGSGSRVPQYRLHHRVR